MDGAVPGWEQEQLTHGSPALHSPAESADELLGGRLSHKQHAGGGWMAAQPCLSPAAAGAVSLPERCAAPEKQSHLCRGRKMQQARRGSLVCLGFHFNSSQALSVLASGAGFPTFATSLSSSGNSKAESSAVGTIPQLLAARLHRAPWLGCSVFKVRVARLFFPPKIFLQSIFVQSDFLLLIVPQTLGAPWVWVKRGGHQSL